MSKTGSPHDCNGYFKTGGPSGVVAFTAYVYILHFYGNHLTSKLNLFSTRLMEILEFNYQLL